MLTLLLENVNTSTILIFLITLFVVWHIVTLPSMRRMPPGPLPLPIVGNFNLVAKDTTDHVPGLMKGLMEKYGKIFCLQLGSQPLIVINEFKLLQEAFVKKSDAFSNRPAHLAFVQEVERRIGKGVILSNDQVWKELRRTSLMAMRDFGMGKKSLEEKIEEEVHVLLQCLSEAKGNPVYVKPFLNKATSNVICNIIFGARFSYDDPKFVELLRMVSEALKINPIFLPTNFFPFLGFLPFAKKLKKTFLTALQGTTNYVKELTADHSATYDPDNLRDFVDISIKTRLEAGTHSHHYTEQNMMRVIVDLFAAGSDTTAISLYWAMLLMAKHQDVQEKCQKEIDEVLGRGRTATAVDRTSLKYNEATMYEVLRYNAIAPLGGSHCTTRDVELAGYHIPAKSLVVGHLGAINRDPTLWPEPDKFDPCHFLDKQGNIVNKELMVSFSMGPRECLGESLAKLEFLMFFTSILQFYKVLPETATTPINLKPSFGVVTIPKQQNLLFQKR